MMVPALVVLESLAIDGERVLIGDAWLSARPITAAVLAREAERLVNRARCSAVLRSAIGALQAQALLSPRRGRRHFPAVVAGIGGDLVHELDPRRSGSRDRGARYRSG